MRTPSNSPARQHRAVTGHDDVRASRARAFQDAVVRFIREDGDGVRRLNEFTEVGHKEGDSGKFFRVAGELAGENREELIDDRPGQRDGIFTIDNLAECTIATAAGQRQRGHEHVGVEDDLHARR